MFGGRVFQIFIVPMVNKYYKILNFYILFKLQTKIK